MIGDTILWIILFCFVICFWYFLVNLCHDFFNKDKGPILPS